MTMTVVDNIKKVEEECAKLYEESAQVWIDMVEYLEIQVVEEKLREVQEKAHKSFESINTLPPAERMMKILA
jgi:hypothetical protein